MKRRAVETTENSTVVSMSKFGPGVQMYMLANYADLYHRIQSDVLLREEKTSFDRMVIFCVQMQTYESEMWDTREDGSLSVQPLHNNC